MQVEIDEYTLPPKISVIRASGVFDATATESIMELYESKVKGHSQNILVDLCGVSFMSSIGIRIINILYYDLHPRGSEAEQKLISEQIRSGKYKAPHLKILCPTDSVQKVMNMAGIDQFIGIYDTEQEALNSFTSEF